MMTVEKAREYGWEERSEAFVKWYNEMDKEVIKVSGLSSEDLPDVDIGSMFENGWSPKAAAEVVLEEAGWYIPDDEDEDEWWSDGDEDDLDNEDDWDDWDDDWDEV